MEGMEWLARLRSSFRRRKTEKVNADWPQWYQDYFLNGEFKHPPNSSLKEVPVIVLDAETTGLDISKDRLISLGGLRVQGNVIQVAEHFEAYLPTPSDLQSQRAVAIHGIIPNSQRYVYSQEDELLAQFLGFVGDAIIVGHHINFDVTMINQLLERHGAGALCNQIIDTAAVAERLQPPGYWSPDDQYTLDNLARRYRISLSDRHTALGDAYITAVLWQKLIAKLGERVKRELELADLKRRGR